MVLGREHQIAHPRLPGAFGQGEGVKIHRVKLPGQLLILPPGDLKVMHDPFRDVAGALPPVFPGQEGIQAPVHKQPKLALLPPGGFSGD